MLNELLDRYPQLINCRDAIVSAGEAMIQCYKNRGKLLLCGNGGSSADCDHIVGELMKIAPAAIRKSKEKIAPFRKPDGGYSYGPNYSSATSQSVPAAVPKSAEGDVNGTVIAVMGIINHIYRALELTAFKAPLFVEADRQRYCKLLEDRKNSK